MDSWEMTLVSSLTIVRVKLSLTLSPTLSVTVTFRLRSPTSLLVGVPLKVRLVWLKFNQLGRGLSLLRAAE